MSGEDDMELHGTRKVREDGSSVVVTIPKEAVEHSGIAVGEQVMVGSQEDGLVALIPWAEDDIRAMLSNGE